MFFRKLHKKMFDIEKRLKTLEYSPPLIPRNYYDKELAEINQHIKALSEKLTDNIQYCLGVLNDHEKIITFIYELSRNISGFNEGMLRRLLNEVGIELFRQNREVYEKYTDILKIKWAGEKKIAVAKINLEKFYSVRRPVSLLNKTAGELFDLREELKNKAIVLEREEKYSEFEQTNSLLKHLEDL